MISRFHVLSVAVAGALACSLAGAQSRNASPARTESEGTRPILRSPASSTARISVASRSARPPVAVRLAADGRTSLGFAATGGFVNPDNFSGVPGLGFDFPHLAAISGGRNSEPAFRHFGHHRDFGQGAFVPIFLGGYPYPYYDDSGYDQSDQQPGVTTAGGGQSPAQPQVIVIQQPVPAQTAQEAASSAANAVPTPAPETSAAPEVRDVGDFILVRRDGRLLFASAFSVSGTQLQYVTPEGVRRSVAVADLDADATQQMNEARGTTVQIHN